MVEEKAPTAMHGERDVVEKVDPMIKEQAGDADEAMKAFEDLQGESITIDEETNKRLLKTIDWHMMPIMRLTIGQKTQASPTPFVALLSLVSSNVAGYTKKTTVAALYLIGYRAGNIIGPQIFRPKDAPRYVPAEITIIVCWGVCLLLLLFIWWWYKKENKRKVLIRASPDYVRLENHERV